jgi:hypothetical protein
MMPSSQVSISQHIHIQKKVTDPNAKKHGDERYNRNNLECANPSPRIGAGKLGSKCLATYDGAECHSNWVHAHERSKPQRSSEERAARNN